MNINNIKFAAQGQEVTLNVTEIPTISENTKAVFEALGTKIPNHLTSFNKKASLLSETMSKLQDAKEHYIRDKLFALLRSVCSVGLIATTFFSLKYFVIKPISSLTLPLALSILSGSALGYHNALSVNISVNIDNILFPLFTWLGGPFFPIYEIFKKIPNLEKSVENQKSSLSAHYIELQNHFNADHSGLQTKLEEIVKKASTSLESLKALPLRVSGEKELEEGLQKHQEALDTLKKAKVFYASSLN